MDRESQTSFIPKSALTTRPVRERRALSLTSVVAVLVFLISLGLWGGTYAYGRLIENSIEAPCEESSSLTGRERSCGLRESIERARQDLDAATTVYLRRLSDKLAIAASLLGEHRTAVPILTMLEELTLPSVYYTRLGYAGNTLTIEGRASSYEDIAVQTQVYGRDQGRIKNFIFSDLDLDSFGNVIFKLVINLEPEAVLYSKTLVIDQP